MDIEGLGPAVLEQLLGAGLIHSIDDIYSIDYEEVKKLERIGEKSVENLKNAIEKSKENDAAKLVFAFGIRHIGSKAAALLTEHFGSIEAIAAATAEEIEQIDGIGSVLADSAAEFFSLPETAVMLESLKKRGVNMKSFAPLPIAYAMQ